MTKINAHVVDICASGNRYCDVRLLHILVLVHLLLLGVLIIFHLLRYLLRRAISGILLILSVEPSPNRLRGQMSRRFIIWLVLLISASRISFFLLCFMDEVFILTGSVGHWNTTLCRILFHCRWHNRRNHLRGFISWVLAIGHLLDRRDFHIFYPFIGEFFIFLYLWLFRWYNCGFIYLQCPLNSTQIGIFHENNTFVQFICSIFGRFRLYLSNDCGRLKSNFGRLSRVIQRRKTCGLKWNLLSSCHSFTFCCLNGCDLVILRWIIFSLRPQFVLDGNLSLFDNIICCKRSFWGATLLLGFLNAPMNFLVWKILHLFFAYLSSLWWIRPTLRKFYFFIDIWRGIFVSSVLVMITWHF